MKGAGRKWNSTPRGGSRWISENPREIRRAMGKSPVSGFPPIHRSDHLLTIHPIMNDMYG